MVESSEIWLYVQISLNSLIAENYEEILESLIRDAKVVDHGRSPCDDLFIPDVADEKLVVYIKMEDVRDTSTWLQMAKVNIWCLIFGF